MTRLATPISGHTHTIFFFITFNFQLTKAITLTCSGDMVDNKILQSDWLRTFWSISQEQKRSQLWNLCRNIANNKSFR